MAEGEIFQEELQEALHSIYEAEGLSDAGSDLLIYGRRRRIGDQSGGGGGKKLTRSWHQKVSPCTAVRDGA